MADVTRPPVWCQWHRDYEPAPEVIYERCQECGHVYETATDLEREFLALHVATMSTRRIGDIPFCPLCLHDF